eukprot:gene12542-12675_t
MAGLQSILDLPLPVADARALPVQRCLFDSIRTATIKDDTRGQTLSKPGGDKPSLSIQIGTPSLSIGGDAEQQEQVQKWLAFSEAQALLRMCVIDTPIRCDYAACADVAVDTTALAAAPLPPPAFRGVKRAGGYAVNATCIDHEDKQVAVAAAVRDKML